MRHQREQLLEAMADDGLDALVLSRPADVTFATGARQLWTAGTRPFAPICVVVRSSGRAHVLPVSWNPANLVRSLAGIDGFAAARRVGTASSTPGVPSLIRAIAPDAEVVDGAPAVWAARTPKTPDEIERIMTATRLAEDAMAAMVTALRPGVSERELLAVYVEHIASQGAPTPPSEGIIGGRPATNRTIADGELVPLDAGAFRLGYEGGIGRTWVCGGGQASRASRTSRATSDRCRPALDAVIAACQAGATGAELKQAWTSTGEPVPSGPLAYGIGLGVELPIIAEGVGDHVVLQAGTVLSIQAEASDGVYERDLVLVVDGPPEVLTRAH